jgi:hypothetical protein
MAGPNSNAFVQQDDLFTADAGDDGSVWKGVGLVRYDISKVTDVRNLRGSKHAYHVRCTFRLRVFQKDQFTLGHDPSTWDDYPAVLINMMQPSLPVGCPDTDIALVDYSPKTINTSVSTDNTQSSGVDGNVMRQHTVGSSSTTTNSFGANVGVGAEGVPTAGVNYEHSQVSESRNELTTSATRGSSQQWSDSAGMTIKDWASFATLGADRAGAPYVRWVWAQEYPWDAVLVRPDDTLQGAIQVPTDVNARMTGNGLLQPPSHLSQMGLDFVCTATWLVEPTAWSPVTEPTILVTHSGTFWQATHTETVTKGQGTNPDTYQLSITPRSLDFPVVNNAVQHTLELESYSLAPITDNGPENGAVLGFIPTEINARDASGFTASSRAGNLFVTGSGFADDMSIDLTAGDGGTLTAVFKILDRAEEYDLVFKHWITGGRPATVRIIVNDNPAISRYVTEKEGEGGDNNVMTVALRSLAFGASDYHDYLLVGRNTLTIQVASAPLPPGVDPQAADTYVLRALAIG